jgi:hypothetical protein
MVSMSLPRSSEESGSPYFLRRQHHKRVEAGYLFTSAHIRVLQDGCMPHNEAKKQPGNATRASVRKEMAKPRMTRSSAGCPSRACPRPTEERSKGGTGSRFAFRVPTRRASLPPAQVANSLCRVQGKRRMCDPEVQIGNSGSLR